MELFTLQYDVILTFKVESPTSEHRSENESLGTTRSGLYRRFELYNVRKIEVFVIAETYL